METDQLYSLHETYGKHEMVTTKYEHPMWHLKNFRLYKCSCGMYHEYYLGRPFGVVSPSSIACYAIAYPEIMPSIRSFFLMAGEYHRRLGANVLGPKAWSNLKAIVAKQENVDFVERLRKQVPDKTHDQTGS